MLQSPARRSWRPSRTLGIHPARSRTCRLLEFQCLVQEEKMDHCSCESKKALDTLKTARGQIDGIIRMIEEDRYCIDVSKQILSATALLKKANITVLRQHMKTCVTDAVEHGAGQEKIDEIVLILDKYLG